MVVASMAFALRSGFERRSEYSYFYQALDSLPETKAIITWTENQPVGRELRENNRSDIATKITESWQAYALAMETNTENYLRDYLTGTALDRSLHVINSGEAKGSNMVMMGVKVDPLLFHLDGSIFQFQSDEAVFARYIIDKEKLVSYSLSDDCILDNYYIRQSGWKLANHELRCSKPISLQPKTIQPWEMPRLKGINYYPKNSPWSFFWRDYDPEIISSDILRMKSLNVNAIRIFLTYDAFLDKNTNEIAISNLEDFFDQTQKAGIFVVPTLFDLRGDLSSWTWLADRYYLDVVLPVLQEANNIAYIDLKNEPDIDQEYQNPALVEAWAKTIIGVSRKIAPELRYSMGWAKAENALKLKDSFDVISYHEYGGLEASAANYQRVKNAANGKPVIVSEIGATSYDFVFSQPSNQKKQAREVNGRINQYKNSDGVFIWTLYDFPSLDPEAVSGSFWHQGIQKKFGLYDEFENEKPAAKVFRDWSFE